MGYIFAYYLYGFSTFITLEKQSHKFMLCNVHLLRYLRKNTEETENQWSKKMSDLMKEINQKRKELLIQEDLFLICTLDYYLTVCEN